MAKVRASSLRRRLRSLGGQVIRRAGWLPGGVADGLGEDAKLLGRTLPHTVLVYFPDAPDALYQLEQWYVPLRELDRKHRVVIVLADSRTAVAVRRDSRLDVIVVARFTTLDDLLGRSDVKVALYVNHSAENFSCLRFPSLIHASLMHGDSDKAVTVSHQVQGYDFSLVAAQAAIDRLSDHVPFFDAERRCIAIGRPQLDEQLRGVRRGARPRAAGEPPTVLYAPTWEGAQPSASYSSVATHGPALVEEFLADGWSVAYRPHPLMGARDGAGHGRADRLIRQRLAAAGPRHRIDSDCPIGESFASADLLVCDVSSVAIEWLPMDRPLVLTEPSLPGAMVAQTPIADLAPPITVDDIPGLAILGRDLVRNDPDGDRRRELVQYYLGDTSPGASTARFLEAVDDLIGRRDAELARLEALRSARR